MNLSWTHLQNHWTTRFLGLLTSQSPKQSFPRLHSLRLSDSTKVCQSWVRVIPIGNIGEHKWSLNPPPWNFSTQNNPVKKKWVKRACNAPREKKYSPSSFSKNSPFLRPHCAWKKKEKKEGDRWIIKNLGPYPSPDVYDLAHPLHLFPRALRTSCVHSSITGLSPLVSVQPSELKISNPDLQMDPSPASTFLWLMYRIPVKRIYASQRVKGRPSGFH